MFLLPSGLQARTFRIPWGTFLLIFASVALTANKLWHGFEIEIYHKAQEFLFQSLTYDSVLQLVMATFLLVAFSTYIEMRMGTLAYLGTYFLGASLGFVLKTSIDNADLSFVPLFALSTLIAPFLIFFLKTPYRLTYFSLPKTKKTILIPSWGLLIVSQISFVVAHIYSQQDYPLETLLGYAIGTLVAFAWKELSFLKKGFLFPIEVTYLLHAKKETDPLKKIDWILECLHLNPSNPQATEYLFLSIAKAKVAPHFFTEAQKDIISNLISAIIKKTVKVDINLVIYYFSLLPLNWNLSDIGLVDIIEDDLDYMNELLEHSEWRIAIRLYDAYLANDSEDEARAVVIANIQTTLNELARIGLKPQDKDWLTEYVLYHSDGHASNLIKATIDLKADSETKVS